MDSFRFITAEEYASLLNRVNAAVNNGRSIDHSQKSAGFIKKVELSSSTREEFFEKIEKQLAQLQLLPLIDWFKKKRSLFEQMLNKIKQKKLVDPNYSSNFSSDITEALHYLEQLLQIDMNEINARHLPYIVKVRNGMQELISSAARKTEASVDQVDDTFVYCQLHDITAMINAFILLPPETNRSLIKAFITVLDGLTESKQRIEDWLDKHRARLDSAYQHRVQIATSLVCDFCKTIKTSNHNTMQTDNDVLGDETSSHTLDICTIYAILSDLKACEWRRIRAVCNSNVSVMENLSRKRKQLPGCCTAGGDSSGGSSSSISTVSSTSLEAQQNSVVALLTSTIDEEEGVSSTLRLQHFAEQMEINHTFFDKYDWNSIIDVGSFGGIANCV